MTEEYTVTVEKMINGGEGLAKIDNLPVFIDGAAPGDELKIKFNKINKKYSSAEIVEIVKPSKYRVKPICALANVCGGCSWLHIDYEQQLVQKQNIIKETLKKIAGIEFDVKPAIKSPKTSEYRCKVQYPVSEKSTGRIVAGYYKKASHELVNIKYCPMHSEIMSYIMENIKNKCSELNISGYNEKTNKGILRHVIFRQSDFSKELIIVFVINSDKIPDNLKKLSEVLIGEYSNIKGICANINTKKTNVILGNKTINLIGNDYYIEKLSDITYKVSASSFFQVNPKTAELIFEYTKEIISQRLNKPAILDAYSGVSSFGIFLSDIASKIVCVEEVKSASEDAVYNAKINKINNIEIINGDASEQFQNLIKNRAKFDVSVIDPPRKGASFDAIKYLVELTDKYIVYVSCNPATLARDTKLLADYGFYPEIVQPFDMFPNTPHIETFVLFKNTH